LTKVLLSSIDAATCLVRRRKAGSPNAWDRAVSEVFARVPLAELQEVLKAKALKAAPVER
jgi:hypothetical protein